MNHTTDESFWGKASVLRCSEAWERSPVNPTPSQLKSENDKQAEQLKQFLQL